MKKKMYPTGQISVYGVHKKARVEDLGVDEEYIQDFQSRCNNDLLNIVLPVLAKLHSTGEVSDFDFIAVYSYLTTNLVHKTLAERITIEDSTGVRYMSKQNVHQNIIRKTIERIIDFIEAHDKNEFRSTFPNAYKRMIREKQNGRKT